jgi:hypothetical protein
MTTENHLKFFHLSGDGSISTTETPYESHGVDDCLDYRFIEMQSYLVINIDTYTRAVAIAVAFGLNPHTHAV